MSRTNPAIVIYSPLETNHCIRQTGKVAGKQISSALILSHQTFGDFARPNPHWHGILLEGGFDEDGKFVYLPISSTKQMTELFRRKVYRKTICFPVFPIVVVFNFLKLESKKVAAVNRS